MEEAGLPGFVVPSWGAFAFPTGTPAPIVAKLAVEVRTITAEPRCANASSLPVGWP
jgi:tripartite-type tricarboxylate transporter receptor subunit TctC